MFELFTPAKLGQHRLFFTCGWTFVVFSVFWYMIGAFPYYEAVQFPDPQRSACLRISSATPASYGSSQLVHWINQVRLTTCKSSLAHLVTPAPARLSMRIIAVDSCNTTSTQALACMAILKADSERGDVGATIGPHNICVMALFLYAAVVP